MAFGGVFVLNRGLQMAATPRGRGSVSRPRDHRTASHRRPPLILLLLHSGLFAYAWVHNRLRLIELRSGRPAPVFHAENVERQRLAEWRNDAILGNHAVLLAAADQFARKK